MSPFLATGNFWQKAGIRPNLGPVCQVKLFLKKYLHLPSSLLSFNITNVSHAKHSETILYTGSWEWRRYISHYSTRVPKTPLLNNSLITWGARTWPPARLPGCALPFSWKWECIAVWRILQTGSFLGKKVKKRAFFQLNSGQKTE